MGDWDMVAGDCDIYVEGFVEDSFVFDLNPTVNRRTREE